MTVHVLPKDGNAFPAETKAKAKAKARPKAKARVSSQQAVGATFNGVIAVVLIGLSLSHLAHGVELTGTPVWEAWAMAIGIDLTFVGLEFTRLTWNDKTKKEISTMTNYFIVLTMLGSAGFNALAFVANSSGWMVYPAAALGMAVPALIYVMSKNATTMWVNR